MKLIIEITAAQKNMRSGISARTQKPYKMYDQKAYFHQGKYPQEIVIGLDEDQAPWPIGMYEVEEQSIYINKYKGLELSNNLSLTPIKQPVKAAS